MNPVRIASARGVMTATLADAESRNALGPALVQGLLDALAAAASDAKMRALVVTNKGSSFCAGADLEAALGRPSRARLRRLRGAAARDPDCPKPVVGRIDGHAVGGGSASRRPRHLDRGRRRAARIHRGPAGRAPAIISVVCLPKMRPGEALEAFLRGHRFPASRAAELGLINRAVPEGQLDAAVEEVVADLRKGGPARSALPSASSTRCRG